MNNLTGKTITCFLCGTVKDIKNSKKGKPYFICEPCGLQVFIRREKGVELLREFLATGKKPENKTSPDIFNGIFGKP
jgi:hypothetical protein